MNELKFLKTNRPIDKRHVEELVKSIEETGYMNDLPIIINQDGYIIDGQHRYMACQILGITPTFATLNLNQDKVNKILLNLNTTSKKWTANDYINYYAEQGNANYIELSRLSKVYNLQPILLATILTDKLGGGSITSLIKKGDFRFDYEAHSKIDDKISAIIKMCEAMRLKGKYKLMQALSLAYNNIYFIPDVFIQKAKNNQEQIYVCHTAHAWLQMIENVYNFANRKKIRLV